MKKSILVKLIKEEYKKVLKENANIKFKDGNSSFEINLTNSDGIHIKDDDNDIELSKKGAVRLGEFLLRYIYK